METNVAKVLILYGTKTGATKNCAEKISKAMESAPVGPFDVNEAKRLDLSPFDTVVIGTPIYMGQIHKKIKRFLLKNTAVLMKKNLHFFICGLARGKEGIDLFQKQISPELFGHATQVAQLGNEIHLEMLHPFYRFIMKKIMETEKPATGLLEDQILMFAYKIVGR
jgi:menaquinone-dependent protoporphyrinogen oxidase